MKAMKAMNGMDATNRMNARKGYSRALVFSSFVLSVALVIACGSKARDPRYPSRNDGCAVKSYAASPTIPVDELGTVTVNCTGAGNQCMRRLLNEVCRVGGDVVWGLGDNPVSSMEMTAHAAHSAGHHFSPRVQGCAVQTFPDAPTVDTVNIGAVSATCKDDVADAECLRELQDQACQLGADVIWGVRGPKLRDGKKYFEGRAAHTKP